MWLRACPALPGITSWSSTQAMALAEPPQRLQTLMPILNTRVSRCSQDHDYFEDFARTVEEDFESVFKNAHNHWAGHLDNQEGILDLIRLMESIMYKFG